MRFGLRISTFIIVCSSLVACAGAKDKCGNKVLALWPSGSGQYTFQEIPLTTLDNPYVLSGRAAKVYFEASFNDAGFEGSVAEPHYTRNGDTCVPMDTDSSMAVSVYAQFERLMQFEEKLGTLDMLAWPRRVGVDIHVKATDGSTHNNAHYLTGGDSIAVLPYDIKGGVPLALNLGILAHEHFHAHFEKQVINPINLLSQTSLDVDSLFYPGLAAPGTKPSIGDVEAQDLKSKRGLNSFVLRAWNEGLADLYGAIYTNNPRFFDESLPLIKEARALTAELQPFQTAVGFVLDASRQTPHDLVNYSYFQGALLARLMYRLAHAGGESPEAFLVRILRRLHTIPAQIGPQLETHVLSFEDIVPLLLEDFPRDASICPSLRATLSHEVMSRNFSQCSGI